MAFSLSAGACELSQKLLNERWTPYLQLRPAVVMLRGGITDFLGGLWSTFSTGSQRVPAPLANTSQRGKQARGGGGLSDCLSLGGPHLIKDVRGAVLRYQRARAKKLSAHERHSRDTRSD